MLFSIGGIGYSQLTNPWPWLVSQAEAEEMAERVATWVPLFGIDGIDIDIEEGAGVQFNRHLEFRVPILDMVQNKLSTRGLQPKTCLT